jgi:hypothetical protein
MENYFTSIEPFYRITNIFFGLLPMSFVKPVRKGNLKFTNMSLLRTSTAFVVLFGIIIIILDNHAKYISEQQPFLGIMVWSWVLILLYPMIVIQFSFQMVKAKDIRNFFNFMDGIDSKFYKLFIKIDHNRHRKIIFRITATIIGSLTVRLIGTFVFKIVCHRGYTTNANVFAQEIAYFGYLLYVFIFSLQFIFTSYLLRERFRTLKDLVR